MKLFSFSIVAITIIASAGAAAAVDRQPDVFRKLLDCRSVGDPGQRLACYDQRVAAMATAEEQKNLVVVDRVQVRQARRSLFGLSLPSLAIFGGGDEKPEEGVSEIESTIRSARLSNYSWTVVLEDGARWVQTDNRTLPIDPKPGQKIRIRKAALGSYLANINGQTAIRMRREN